MNEKKQTFSPKEIRKLKSDYYNRLFPNGALLLFLILMVFIHSSLSNSFGFTFYVFITLSIIISCFLFHQITKNHRLDLKFKEVVLDKKNIDNLVYKVDYEPGRTTVPVNLISLLFLKSIFSHTMKEIHIYYIEIDGEKIYIDKEIFEKLKSEKTALIRKAKHTGLILDICISPD